MFCSWVTYSEMDKTQETDTYFKVIVIMNTDPDIKKERGDIEYDDHHKEEKFSELLTDRDIDEEKKGDFEDEDDSHLFPGIDDYDEGFIEDTKYIMINEHGINRVSRYIYFLD